MSDATDDLDSLERELLRRSRSSQLRTQMRAFVQAHQAGDVKVLRRRISDGTELSRLVDEERDEEI